MLEPQIRFEIERAPDRRMLSARKHHQRFRCETFATNFGRDRERHIDRHVQSRRFAVRPQDPAARCAQSRRRCSAPPDVRRPAVRKKRDLLGFAHRNYELRGLEAGSNWPARISICSEIPSESTNATASVRASGVGDHFVAMAFEQRIASSSRSRPSAWLTAGCDRCRRLLAGVMPPSR